MATIIDIAGAVVAELNGPDGPTFGDPLVGLDAERGYRPLFELGDLKDLRVTVVPRAVDLATASRSTVQADVQIDIGIQKKLPATDQDAEADALMQLAEEVADFFRTHPLTGVPDAAWVRSANEPVYSPEHWDEFRQFTSIVTATFRVLR